MSNGVPILPGNAQSVLVVPQTMYARVVPELQAKLRIETILKVFDPLRTGTPDPDRIALIEQPANADIDSALLGPGGIYPELSSPFRVKLVELALMGMEWRMGYHWQSLWPIDWVTIKQMVDADLDKIRKGHKTLGGKPPDPAANQGGAVIPGSMHGVVKKGGIFGRGNCGNVF